MSFRLLLASGLLSLLAGCVSVGNTDLLITPIGVAALHSFKPKEPPRDALADARDRDPVLTTDSEPSSQP